MTIEQAQERITELEAAIREHRDAKGDDRCWLDDEQLYKVLHDGVDPDGSLPPCDEFLGNCIRYWKCRKSGQPYISGEERLRRLESNPTNVFVGRVPGY